MSFIDLLGFSNFIDENTPLYSDTDEMKEFKLNNIKGVTYALNEQFEHHGIIWPESKGLASKEEFIDGKAISYSDNY